MHHILFDHRSSAGILFKSALDQIDIEEAILQPVPIYGFYNNFVETERMITLPVTIGKELFYFTRMINFLLINCSSVSNAIIGRPTLDNMKAFTSAYHLMKKFPNDNGSKKLMEIKLKKDPIMSMPLVEGRKKIWW